MQQSMYLFNALKLSIPFQVLCNTGKLTQIPKNFPPETQEITITHQNIKSIPPNGNKINYMLIMLCNMGLLFLIIFTYIYYSFFQTQVPEKANT